MNKTFLLQLCLLASAALSAQNITIDFGFHSGKEVSLCLKNGTDCDTVSAVRFDDKGQARIVLPEKYRNYRGMATVKTGDYAEFNFIIAGENFSLHCDEEYPHGGNVTFTGSAENAFLQSRFITQAVRQQKTGLLMQAQELYSSDDPFHTALLREIQTLNAEQAALEKELAGSPLYAARFIEFHNFLNDRVSRLMSADSTEMSRVRTFVRDSLDINALFGSGLWFGTLNGLLALYDNGTPYHEDFITDMSLLLERAQTERIHNTLAENLFAICESTGWNDLEEQLAYYLINSGRISKPTGKLQMLMTLFKLGKGSRVPALSSGALPAGKILLLFYESGCGHCENEIRQLIGNYSMIREKGYEVMSVSADTDPQVYKNLSDTFPWAGKYCSFEGFGGTDFKNFGVIGTPTFYVINSGTLQGRYARLEDVKW